MRLIFFLGRTGAPVGPVSLDKPVYPVYPY